MEKLSKDDVDSVKDAIAYRDLPQEWKSIDDYEKIEKLKEEEDVDVAVIKILANSSDYSLREAVTICPNVPIDTLKILSYDKDSDVCQSAQKKLLPEEWKHLDDDEKFNKLQENDVSEEILVILAGPQSTDIRNFIVNYKNIDINILKKLSKDEDYEIQKIAQNRLLPDQWRDLEANETYYINVTSALSSQAIYFDLCVYKSPAPPSNDDCTNPIALNVGQSFEDSFIVATNTSATINPGNSNFPSCGTLDFSTRGRDIWFTVVVPESGSFTIETKQMNVIRTLITK